MKFKNTYYSKNGKMVFKLDMMPLTIIWLVIAVFFILIGLLFDDWAARIFFIAFAIVPAPLFYPFRYITISDTELVMSIGIIRRKYKFSEVEKCLVRICFMDAYSGIFFYDAKGKRRSVGLVYYENIDKICHELSNHVKNIEVFRDGDYEFRENKLSDEAKKIIEVSLQKPKRSVYLFIAILFFAVAGGISYYIYSE